MTHPRGAPGGLRRLLTPAPDAASEPGAAADPSPDAPADPTAASVVAAPRRAPRHRRAIDGWPTLAQLVQGATLGTGVFLAAAVASAARPEWFAWLGVGVSIGLFALGCVAFVIGYARAVGRSRHDELDLPGLFFLVGSVEPAVRRRLLLLLAVQVVGGLAAAAVRPFTPVAFCTLAPVFGLGALALCGATHGRFPARRL